MSKYILSIAVGHNSSTTLLQDGAIVFHIEEERLSRVKRDGNPFKTLLQVSNFTNQIDKLVITSTEEVSRTPWNGKDHYTEILEKSGVKVAETQLLHDGHHLCHVATSFYNSGFDDAIVVVVDGAGSSIQNEDNREFEAESIYRASYDGFVSQYSSKICNEDKTIFTELGKLLQNPTTVKMYEGVTQFLGWHPIEAGKTMGLSAYGKYDTRIPDLFDTDNRGKSNIFEPHYPATSTIKQDTGFYSMQKDEQFRANLARKIQFNSEYLVGELVRQAIEMNPDCKRVCIGGGYGLNVINNTKLTEKFPKHEFWFEPTCNDAGNSIGAAKMVYMENGGDRAQVQGMANYYLGFDWVYDKDMFDKVENYNVISSGCEERIAELIHQGEIVALVQGRSEAGPRALGNRSFLFNATREHGKDEMNKIKKREWFRPFACAVLEEDAPEWFEMGNIKKAPYMMMAFKTSDETRAKIPAVVHEDNTTRIQTVGPSENKVLREILEKYKKLSNVGVIGNTSYNLSGEPLVETMEDALRTFEEAEFNYLYLADMGIILSKKDR